MSVTLKLALSLDGRIAAANGESQWITGPEARQAGHRLRAVHDAVLIGSGTALADDPDLRVRLPGYSGVQPLRVVADARLRVSASSTLINTASEDAPVLILTGQTSSPDKRAALVAQSGVSIAFGEVTPEGIEPQHVLSRVDFALRQAGRIGPDQSARVYLEGGGHIAASFLNAGLVSQLEVFRAPLVLGAEGAPGIARLFNDTLKGAPRFERVGVQPCGPDIWERYAAL